MSDSNDPRTAEEYMKRVMREAKRMESEHVPSHRELIEQYN